MAEAAASSLNKEQRATPYRRRPQIHPAWDMPFGTFLQRATLLDANKRVLIAPEIAKRDVNYQAIKLNGAIIGWLSIGKIDMDILPLAQYFLSAAAGGQLVYSLGRHFSGLIKLYVFPPYYPPHSCAHSRRAANCSAQFLHPH